MVKLTRVYQERRLWYILLQLLTNKKVPFSDGRGWHIDESAHLPPLRPGYDSRTQCHLSFLSAWVCYWFSSLPREFLPESFSFSSSSKINTLNSNSKTVDWKSHRVKCPLLWLYYYCYYYYYKIRSKNRFKVRTWQREQQKQYHAEIGWSLFWIRAKGNIYPIRGSRSG